ncbi:hypothetical protein BKA70DRAFT_1565151 [Coprinopsis sp. MPI-PUGE-AT-0042]|nr:hypothetical protein BKA70DRAFT_1565151 [Coprinopsis sp. MPI-PUGE-AT-0042]
MTSALPPSTTTLSFQLPDLLSQINSFTFRTNPKTRHGTNVAEAWLSKLECLTESERQSLTGAKYGLLAGLCCPTCDGPDVAFLAQALALIWLSYHRLLNREERYSEIQEWIEQAKGISDGIAILKLHPLLRSIVPLIEHKLNTPYRQESGRAARWRKAFSKAVQSYHQVIAQVDKDLTEGKTPSFAEYIALRREVCATSLFWKLVELLEIFSPPTEVNSSRTAALEAMAQYATDIVAWATDIFAYAEPNRSRTHNLVSLLVAHRGLSIQGAMNYAGGMVKERVEEFRRLESALLPPVKEESDSSWTSTWLRSIPGLTRSASFGSRSTPQNYLSGIEGESPAPPLDDETLGIIEEGQARMQVTRYILGLKDYIIGSIHWGYETELFFGTKGDETRSFGWVFLTIGSA